MTRSSDPTGPAYPTVPAPPPAPLPAMGGRLHPAAIAVWSFAQVGAVVFLVIVNPISFLGAVPILAVIAGLSAVRWSRFTWRLEGATLVIEQGLLQRQRRVIPVDRIQSVDVVRKLSHRAFGVVAVQVEAIGGADTEGQLDAISPDLARRLRATLLAGRKGMPPEAAGAVPAEQEGEVLVSVPRRSLVLAGLTEANVTLLAGAGGLLFELFGNRLGDPERLPDRLSGLLGPTATIAVALLAAVGAVTLLIAAQYLTYWDFTLRRTGGELRVRRGLLEQRFDTIPLRRLQSVRIEQNLPRRLLGFAAVKADVAGSAGSSGPGTDVLLPFGRLAQAQELVAVLLADRGVAELPLTAMPRRALTRRVVRAALLVAVLVAIGTIVWGAAGLAVLAVTVPALGAAVASYRALGHAETDRFLVTRAGWWVRRTAFVPVRRVQALEESATLAQRWRDLATLDLQIARSPGLWQGPRMIDLDAIDARVLTLALAPQMAGHDPPTTTAPRSHEERGAADAVVGGGFEPP